MPKDVCLIISQVWVAASFACIGDTLTWATCIAFTGIWHYAYWRCDV